MVSLRLSNFLQVQEQLDDSLASHIGLLRRRLTLAQSAQDDMELGWQMFQMCFAMHALFQISNFFIPNPPLVLGK